MKQDKAMSLVEACLNMSAVCGAVLATEKIFLFYFGPRMNMLEIAGAVIFFVSVSIAASYGLRRAFEAITRRNH
jgi:hypothetical protein